MGRIYGYARCSTNDTKQDITRQIRELKNAGAERVFVEYEHGDSVLKKAQEELFEIMEDGDSVVTTEISRLARSTKQMCCIIDIIREKKVRLMILNSVTLDCRGSQVDPLSEAFIQIGGVFSQLELSIGRQRVKSGMANAKAKGVKIGRPKTTKDNLPMNFLKYYPMYKNGGINVSEFSRLAEVSRKTIYKYIGIAEA